MTGCMFTLYINFNPCVEPGPKQTDSSCLIISLHYNTCRSHLLTKDDRYLSSLISVDVGNFFLSNFCLETTYSISLYESEYLLRC